MKKIILFSLAILFSLTFVSAFTVVNGTWSKTYTISAASYPLKSCNIQANYENGSCQYLYFCYAVVPRGTTDLSQAAQKECIDITNTKTGTLTVSLVPPKGIRWAVTTFVGVLDYKYNYTAATWSKNLTIPIDYRSAEEIISLCPSGQMLKYNMCYSAQSVCLNTFSYNLCTNPYQLYVLDVGFGFRYNDASSYCADRNEDLLCDEVLSVICPDTNNNKICDADDVAIQNSSCIDANQNYVCDSVEGTGTFCRTNFEPVNCGNGTSCITYPNICFAKATGCSNPINGTCTPIYANLCYSDSECNSLSPCSGVFGTCKNPDNLFNRCFYSGECNLRVVQCSKDSDCPSEPCIGISKVCNLASNSCTYSGSCITQPTNQTQTIWDLLRTLWNKFLQWLNSIFS